MARVIITGGAGYVGSHLADALVSRGEEVVIYDDLSTGNQEFIPKQAIFVEGSLCEYPKLEEAVKGTSHVYHLAAHADVRGGTANLGFKDLRSIEGTHNLLAAMQRQGVNALTYTSSAVVYGEPTLIPTPEYYSGDQTSHYGASKLACEAFIHSFSANYGLTACIFRFVSLIGERYSHGVVFDFVKKLKADPTKLEILGDGSQRKSYLYVDDAIQAMLKAPRITGQVRTYNLGHDYAISVCKVADIVMSEMGLKGVQGSFTGGKRGWIGDSPLVHLDTTKIKRLGWSPSLTIEEGIRRTVRYLLDNPKMLLRT